jgi:hypothetical protein
MLLPTWVAIIFFLEPRISVVFIAIPLVMLVASVLDEVILHSIETITNKKVGSEILFARTLFFLFLLGNGVISGLNIDVPKIR